MPIVVRNDVSPHLVGGMALAAGQGEYQLLQQEIARRENARNQEFAFRAEQQMFQAEQDAMARAQQLAARQQEMQFNDMARQRDAFQQFARTQQLDQQNFGQARQQDEWRAAMEQKNFESRLNAEGKAEKAKWERQRQAVEAYKGKLKPEQYEMAMAEVDAGYAGIKNPRYLTPDPPSFDEDIKINGKEVDGGWIARKPDGSWYGINKPKDAAAIAAEQAEARQEVARIAADAKTKLEEEKARAKAELDAIKAQLDADKQRIDAMRDFAGKLLVKDPETGKMPSGAEVARIAREAADALFGASRPESESAPQPSPPPRAPQGLDQERFNKAFSELPPEQQEAVRNMLSGPGPSGGGIQHLMPQGGGAQRPPVPPVQGGFMSGPPNSLATAQPGFEQMDYQAGNPAATPGSRPSVEELNPAPARIPVQGMPGYTTPAPWAAQPAARDTSGGVSGPAPKKLSAAEDFAKNAQLVRSKEEYERLIASGALKPGDKYLKPDGKIYTVGG